MCGIFGAVGHQLSDSALKNVLDVLEHRGPDGNGAFVDEAAQVTLVHTRLAVIDLAGGAQPLENDDGDILLVCNGEIYDFERIRASLEQNGHHFKTGSDSEVILRLYEEFGLACFEHLRGEFAFLLYDRAKRLLIAARDRFGIKPLYFSRTSDGFVFASEMKAIFASALVEARLNLAALDPLLQQDPDHVQFPFEDIEHVPPGCYMTVALDTHTSSMNRYWSAEIPAAAAVPVPTDDHEAVANCGRSVLAQLETAVRLRLRADVPVGLYLSGGIDSAFVGALMQRNLRSPCHSFSISFVGSDKDEREYALQAAQHLGTVHHELAVTKGMLWDHLQDGLWHSELPFVSLAPIGKFLLSQEARKFVTVVLTGEGADEVFLGYRTFFQKAINDTRGEHRAGARSTAQVRRLKLGFLPKSLLQKFSLLMFNRSNRHRLTESRATAIVSPDPSKPEINAVQEARVAGMPLDILCYLGDREEMAHSLEARLPFLDHQLYDAAKSIPVDFKMRDGTEKAILREAASGILPDDIRLRRKSGFMLTSDAVDLFGADRDASKKLRTHLSREAFSRAEVFSYGAYLAVSLLARIPTWNRVPSLRRLRRNSNKVLMYMMQTHLLHSMFIENPRWGPEATPVATQ